MTSTPNEPLLPQLAHAKDTLKSALANACETDIDRANTGELIRIEETLAIANEAAKEAVSVRRLLASERAKTADPSGQMSRCIARSKTNAASVGMCLPCGPRREKADRRCRNASAMDG